MNSSNKRANLTALTRLESTPTTDELKMGTTKASVNGDILRGGNLRLYPPFRANIQTCLSLDILHYTQFPSSIIPNSTDLISILAVRGKQKDSSRDTNKPNKKKGGRF